MANQVMRLWVDTSRKSLVVSDLSTVSAPRPIFVQGDTLTLVIVLLDPNAAGGIKAPWSRVSVSGLSCRVGIGTPTSAVGTAAPGIFQNSFTLDVTNNTLTGTLYITPATVASLLGSATSGDSTLEIEIAEGGNYSTVYCGSCTLLAELIESAAAPPGVPSDTYMTTNESLAAFVRKIGLAGESVTLTSPDGTKQCILYVDDNGQFHADAV